MKLTNRNYNFESKKLKDVVAGIPNDLFTSLCYLMETNNQVIPSY